MTLNMIKMSTIIYGILYNAIQHKTVQCTTVQYSTVRYGTVQYSTVQYSTVQYSTLQYSTVQYSTVQYSTIQLPLSIAVICNYFLDQIVICEVSLYNQSNLQVQSQFTFYFQSDQFCLSSTNSIPSSFSKLFLKICIFKSYDRWNVMSYLASSEI